MSDSEDDDIPQLSSHTLAALQEFYAEQKQQIDPGGDDKYNIGIIGENWVSKRVPRLSGSSGVEPVLCLVQCSSASHLIPKSILPVIRELHLFGELGQKAVPEYFKTARVQIFLVLALKQVGAQRRGLLWRHVSRSSANLGFLPDAAAFEWFVWSPASFGDRENRYHCRHWGNWTWTCNEKLLKGNF